MLSPETWSFKAPDSSLKIEKHLINNNNCFQTVQKFPYNHLISVVLPNTLRTPEVLCDLLKTDCEYYKVCNLSLDELAKIKFITNFVKKGAVSALSIGTRIDTDDCVCLTADGLMVLSLRKEIYETFGLEGAVSYFFSKSKERYIVHINLLTLQHGTKRYEKTQQCLKRLDKFTLITSWEPPEDGICPSSLAKYFSDLKYEVKRCTPDFDVKTSYSIKVPVIENISEFIEWLGVFSLEIETEILNDYLTTYNTPQPYHNYGQVKHLQSKGFFSCGQIQKVIKALIPFAKNEDVPWVSLYVQGFSDSAVAWNGQEHHYYTNGDNSYVIIITSESYWVVSHLCSRRSYK